eukprot:gnl/MRDRNA2_/MRDRNA2_227396_c0_seq1.p1 gnl/MRDRNA2_/MRDRNA2_227396_c0~~gnl/MRDRNA2_/MRDRNA2_227396_c0_seq1.p1  ORF type:complete len:344 (+),score=54.92 gnl/MRDRNA2_/MRDRNA2_227396_c0_seq1:2-1033(+)
MARLAERNVVSNGFKDVIEVHRMLSTALTVTERCDVLVSETLGAWMTCEGIVQWCEDAAERLLIPGAPVIPKAGKQYAVLIESEDLDNLFSCRQPYRGLDLSSMMELQDTSSFLWSKRLGIRASDLSYKELCEPFVIYDVEFGQSRFFDLPEAQAPCVTMQRGRVDAVLQYWVVSDSKGRTLSTNPKDCCGKTWAYARDVGWGNTFQLVDGSPATDQEEDTTWSIIPDSEVDVEPDDVQDVCFEMDASDLRLCRCVCVHRGMSGFSVLQTTSGSIACFYPEELLDCKQRFKHNPSSSLHIWKGPHTRTPRLPVPLNVEDGDRILVLCASDPSHSRMQFELRKV